MLVQTGFPRDNGPSCVGRDLQSCVLAEQRKSHPPGERVTNSDIGTPQAGPADPADSGDADLVLRTRSGDRAAFAELWRRHYLSGITVARSVTSSLDPDDLVQEAFTRIYQSVIRGGGPTGSFRAYLFTSIRNTAATWGRMRRDSPMEGLESVEDPATSDHATTAALDRTLTHRAFRSLPTRWQEVLWYSEIEQMKPAEIAPLLGMKPTAVAQLTFRAREGLREAWIQVHLRSVADGSDCQWTIERLGAYARAGIGRRDRVKVEAHLGRCARCAIVASEAKEVSSRLALVLLPLTVGAVGTAGYIASLQSGGVPVVALAAMPSSVMQGAVTVVPGMPDIGALAMGAGHAGAAAGVAAGTAGGAGSTAAGAGSVAAAATVAPGGVAAGAAGAAGAGAAGAGAAAAGSTAVAAGAGSAGILAATTTGIATVAAAAGSLLSSAGASIAAGLVVVTTVVAASVGIPALVAPVGTAGDAAIVAEQGVEAASGPDSLNYVPGSPAETTSPTDSEQEATSSGGEDGDEDGDSGTGNGHAGDEDGDVGDDVGDGAATVKPEKADAPVRPTPNPTPAAKPTPTPTPAPTKSDPPAAATTNLPDGSPTLSGGTFSGPAEATTLALVVGGVPGATVQARIHNVPVASAVIPQSGTVTLLVTPSERDLQTGARIDVRYVDGSRFGPPVGARLSEFR